MHLRRRKMVRLHMADPGPTLQGIYTGRPAGHYRLLKPELLEGEERTLELGGEVLVPKERVIFLQVLR